MSDSTPTTEEVCDRFVEARFEAEYSNRWDPGFDPRFVAEFDRWFESVRPVVARPELARIKALLTMLVDEGHATPEAQRQILRLWEKEQ